MTISANELQGVTVLATDGDAGRVKDLYFDDERWTVRYLVVETGGWFDSRQVLVSPRSVTGTDIPGQGLRLDLSRQQIRNAPDIDTHQPVSRQHEAAHADYYGYPYYWGPMAWGDAATPLLPTAVLPSLTPDDSSGEMRVQREIEQARAAQAEPHLRSSREVVGYDLRALDDSVGHVDDFLVDETDWSIRLMVVDTRNWWPGRKVLVPPQRIKDVSWDDRKLSVDITRAEVEGSPEYDPADLAPGDPPHGMYRVGGGRRS